MPDGALSLAAAALADLACGARFTFTSLSVGFGALGVSFLALLAATVAMPFFLACLVRYSSSFFLSKKALRSFLYCFFS